MLMNTVYKVYWTQIHDKQTETKVADFTNDKLVTALAFMESLRATQRYNNSISFITMCSENPDSVGNPGVGVTGSNYVWTKRR